MTLKETATLLGIIQIAYPIAFKDKSKEELMSTAKLWQMMFDEQPFEVVQVAVKSFIASDTKGFPCSIGQINEIIARLQKPADEMTEMEAWARVRQALCNSSYNSQSEFDKLPSELQRLVGSATVLREWAMHDAEDVDTVIASNFQRSYRAKIKSIKEFELLPTDVRNFLSGAAKSLPSEEQLKADALARLETI